MIKKEDIIKSPILFENIWIRYRRYSANCYRLYLGEGFYMVLTEKENYVTGKVFVNLDIYIEQGFKLYHFDNIDIDMKQIWYVDASEYIENIFSKNLNSITRGNKNDSNEIYESKSLDL